jgi:hypothetical protein
MKEGEIIAEAWEIVAVECESRKKQRNRRSSGDRTQRSSEVTAASPNDVLRLVLVENNEVTAVISRWLVEGWISAGTPRSGEDAGHCTIASPDSTTTTTTSSPSDSISSSSSSNCTTTSDEDSDETMSNRPSQDAAAATTATGLALEAAGRQHVLDQGKFCIQKLIDATTRLQESLKNSQCGSNAPPSGGL